MIEKETIGVGRDISADNDRAAVRNHHVFKAKNILAVNLMSSPGAGKTAFIEATVRHLSGKCAIEVVEGNVANRKDCGRIESSGAECRLIEMQGECRMDAEMLTRIMDMMTLSDNSLVLIESVENLVSPSMLSLGEDIRVVMISAADGEDIPLKYPSVFAASHVCVISKTDLLPCTDVDIFLMKQNILNVNPDMVIFEVSARLDEGMDKWCDYLLGRLNENFSVERYFDSVAESWDEHGRPDMACIRQLLSVAKIKEGDTVLDIGSGTGVLLPYLSDVAGVSGTVVAVDCSSRMIDVSRRKYSDLPNVIFRHIDVEKKVVSWRFDCIVMFNMFPHLKYPFSTLRRLVEKNLKEGGRLVIAHSMGRNELNSLHSKQFADGDYFPLPEVSKLAERIVQDGLRTSDAVDDDRAYRIVVTRGIRHYTSSGD